MSSEPSGSCLDCDLGISWQDRGKHEVAVWRDGGFGYDLIPKSHPHNLVSGDAVNPDKLLPIVKLRAAFAFDERLARLDIRSTNDSASSTAIGLYAPGAYGDDLGLPPAVAPLDDEEHHAVVTSPVGGERDRSALARFYHVERIRGPHDGPFTCRHSNRVRLKSHPPHVNGGDTESPSRQACLARVFGNVTRAAERERRRDSRPGRAIAVVADRDWSEGWWRASRRVALGLRLHPSGADGRIRSDVEPPEVRYARTVDGVNIAYQVRGDGPVDLVYTLGMAGNFEIEFEAPWGTRFLERLASFSRVILFDKRGTGLSDRVLGAPDFDMRADDLRAVLDAAGSERAVIVGNRGGGSLAAFFAAMHPDRVFALVLYNSWARTAWAPDYPVGTSTDDLAAWRSEIAAHWGTARLAKRFLRSVAPSRADDAEWIRWEARSLRHGASPAAALAFDEFEQGIDVRSVLHTVQAPTLVLSRSEAARARSADLAARIPGARHVPVPGEDWMPYAGDIDVLLGEIERFVRSVHAEEATFERVLTTVLFTDLVSSTETAAQLGDHAWKGVVERHHATIRAMIGRYRGTEVDTAGDGFFATFDGPARAVRCAKAIVDAVRPLGIAVRVGVHTGEVELIDAKVGGIAVAIGARVAARAGPGDVLVSQTVKDLTVGSGLGYTDAGEHELKGVPGEWRLYRLVAGV